jgi:hypothetical protein
MSNSERLGNSEICLVSVTVSGLAAFVFFLLTVVFSVERCEMARIAAAVELYHSGEFFK